MEESTTTGEKTDANRDHYGQRATCFQLTDGDTVQHSDSDVCEKGNSACCHDPDAIAGGRVAY